MRFLKEHKNLISLFISFLMGLIIWLVPTPVGVDPPAWRLLAILTNTLTMVEAFSGFSNEIVWLVVFAFFISRGFILTGLGSRIAYRIMSHFGKNSLGLGYGLVLTDL